MSSSRDFDACRNPGTTAKLGFLPPAAGTREVIGLSAVYVAVATLVHAGLVTAAGTAHGWLSDAARERRVRRVMALSLVGVAIWVIWKT